MGQTAPRIELEAVPVDSSEWAQAMESLAEQRRKNQPKC